MTRRGHLESEAHECLIITYIGVFILKAAPPPPPPPQDPPLILKYDAYKEFICVRLKYDAYRESIGLGPCVRLKGLAQV